MSEWLPEPGEPVWARRDGALAPGWCRATVVDSDLLTLAPNMVALRFDTAPRDPVWRRIREVRRMSAVDQLGGLA